MVRFRRANSEVGLVMWSGIGFRVLEFCSEGLFDASAEVTESLIGGSEV